MWRWGQIMKQSAGYIKDFKFYNIVARLPLPFFLIKRVADFICLLLILSGSRMKDELKIRDKATRVEPNRKGRKGD